MCQIAHRVNLAFEREDDIINDWCQSCAASGHAGFGPQMYHDWQTVLQHALLPLPW